MNHQLAPVRVLVVAAFGLLIAAPAQAASLQQVSSWGASGVPSYISMYIYVPDKLATNPPILVCSHYCGGDAKGVFGQASGIVKDADQYGFIMIFPQTTNNCWDVGSSKSLTHDGGGDTQAIAQMVKYTITKYQANADRVYATGTSSGAMMTEALLAVYPDVFKAGSEFAGVPAGCWADGYSSSNQWSGNCAGGRTTHTAQEWGDMVRKMYSGYTGHRPRVQLWHGDADSTISPTNQTEAIKEWTNVLGLSTNPTSTTTVSLSGKSWTRQSWTNSCGFTVLDAWTEKGGPHGTSANLNAQYVVPFLALDKTDAVDPEIAQCAGDGGVAGTGGSTGAGGGTGGGGTSGGRDGGPGREAGSAGGGAGGIAAGGSAGSGSGGAAGSGGKSGAPGSGGVQGSGGSGSGGAQGSGGALASGGTTGSGGNNGSGGNTRPAGSGGKSGSGGSSTSEGSSSGGCSCALGAAAVRRGCWDMATVAFGFGLLALVRRRKSQAR
jgi:acetylxylan esterase